MWQKINMNDVARVKLTDVGIEHYAEYWADLGIAGQSPTIGEDGYFHIQLWELASIFGSRLGNGLPVPFETTIELKHND